MIRKILIVATMCAAMITFSASFAQESKKDAEEESSRNLDKRNEQINKLKKFYLDDKISIQACRLGERLFMADQEQLDAIDLKLLSVFQSLLDGKIEPTVLQKHLDLIETEDERILRLQKAKPEIQESRLNEIKDRLTKLLLHDNYKNNKEIENILYTLPEDFDYSSNELFRKARIRIIGPKFKQLIKHTLRKPTVLKNIKERLDYYAYYCNGTTVIDYFAVWEIGYEDGSCKNREKSLRREGGGKCEVIPYLDVVKTTSYREPSDTACVWGDKIINMAKNDFKGSLGKYEEDNKLNRLKYINEIIDNTKLICEVQKLNKDKLYSYKFVEVRWRLKNESAWFKDIIKKIKDSSEKEKNPSKKDELIKEANRLNGLLEWALSPEATK